MTVAVMTVAVATSLMEWIEMRQNFKNATLMMAGLGLIFPVANARAVTVDSTSTPFTVNDPGSFSPVCEVSSVDQIIRGTVDDQLFQRDIYYIGVTDATGTIGLNNLGLPNPQQIRSLQVGVTTVALGFIDRADLNSPKFMTIWEGIPDVGNSGSFRPGAVLAQIPIPASVILANCAGSNQTPSANAGADIGNVVPGSLVTLDGTASTDPDNDALTYSWVQTSGPAVTLDDATSPTPSFTAPGGAGSTPITFQLVVNDGTVSSVADSITISFLDNIATAQAQAGEFMVARNALLLAHQPDLQRRIDRLNGTARGGSANVAGVSLPPATRLPLAVSAFNGNIAANTSLAAARGTGTVSGRWDIWAEAYLVDHRFGTRNGDAAIIYGGVDYAISPGLLVGVLGQYDHVEADSMVTTGVLDGEGWMVGPYATARLAPNLYADVRAAWGKSDNRISPFGSYVDTFDTERVLLGATLTGEFEPAPNFTIRPEIALHWIKDRQQSYVDTPGSMIPAQSFELGQLSFAPRAMYSFETANGSRIRPFVEARGAYDFGDRLGVLAKRTHARVEGGVDLLTSAGLRLSASGFLDGIGDSTWRASGVRANVAYTF